MAAAAPTEDDEEFSRELAALEADVGDLDAVPGAAGGRAGLEDGEEGVVEEGGGKRDAAEAQVCNGSGEPKAKKRRAVVAVAAANPTLSKEFLDVLENVSSGHKRRPTSGARAPDDSSPAGAGAGLANSTNETNKEALASSSARARIAAEIADQERAAQSAGGEAFIIGPQGPPQRPAKHLRTAAGKVWEDPTLAEWPENDFRLWVGQLGPECTHATLSQAFSGYGSFNMARVVMDKRTNECRGFGFVSFSDPMEMVRAMRENRGKYCGNRRMKITRSRKEKRDLDWVKQRKEQREQLLQSLKSDS